MIQHGSHDGTKLVPGEGRNQVEDRRRRILRFQPHQQPQQLDTGKGVELRQAETDWGSVYGDLNVLIYLAHRGSLWYILQELTFEILH